MRYYTPWWVRWKQFLLCFPLVSEINVILSVLLLVLVLELVLMTTTVRVPNMFAVSPRNLAVPYS